MPFVGLADWYPPNYDCGACGYATCAEFLHATRLLRDDSHDLEFAGPTCNLRDIDLGISVGSAAKSAAIHSIDCRCQTRIAVAARKLGVIRADIAVAPSLSLTHKAVGFDRKIGEVDFDALDLPATCTLPIRRRGRAPRRRRPQPPTAPVADHTRQLLVISWGTILAVGPSRRSRRSGVRFAASGLTDTPLTWTFMVVGTGVDPVTFRFSGGRSAD